MSSNRADNLSQQHDRADGVVLTLEVTPVILRGGGCEERHEPEASTHYSILAVLRRCM